MAVHHYGCSTVCANLIRILLKAQGAASRIQQELNTRPTEQQVSGCAPLWSTRLTWLFTLYSVERWCRGIWLRRKRPPAETEHMPDRSAGLRCGCTQIWFALLHICCSWSSSHIWLRHKLMVTGESVYVGPIDQQIKCCLPNSVLPFLLCICAASFLLRHPLLFLPLLHSMRICKSVISYLLCVDSMEQLT